MSDTGLPQPAEPPLPPEPPRRKLSASHRALWGLVAFLIAAKLLQMAIHLPLTLPGAAVLFSWEKGVAFFIALAFLGAGFAHVVTFPGMWDDGISNRGRIWLAIGTGVVLGLVMLGLDHVVHFSRALQAASGIAAPSLAFPASLLYYSYVGVCSAILFHLFTLSFVVWLIGVLILARSWPRATFWIVAIIVSLWEPLFVARQNHWALLHAQPLAGIAAMLGLYYAGDLLGAAYFRRFGFTAVLLLRLSMVIVWHIIGKL